MIYDSIQNVLKKAAWNIGTRKETIALVLHFNGPNVKAFGNPQGEIAQLVFDSGYHMRPGALGAASGGDGLQYHGATLSNGRNVQCRDFMASLWHCGNAHYNPRSIAWHVPIGVDQQPTKAQLDQIFGAVIPFFMQMFPRIQRQTILGHLEVNPTNCPGKFLMLAIKAWRDRNPITQLPLGMQYWITTANVKVRTAPDVNNSRVVMIVPKGTPFGVDTVISGVPVNDNNQWVHRADALGFMSTEYVVKVDQK